MSIFSIENVLNQKIIKNLIDMNYHVIINDLSQTKKDNREKKEEENLLPLSLIHPKYCQPKIPIKDRSSLTRPNLKTMDDIFDIQSSITSVLLHTEDIEYNTIHHYYKWDCENYSEEYGYTHFYIVVSLVDDLPYYAIEVQLISGTKLIINFIIDQLSQRLNLL